MYTWLSFFRSAPLHAALAFMAVLSLCVSGALTFLGNAAAAETILSYTLLVGMLPLWFQMLRDIARGHFGVDLIAAVALLGTYVFNQPLPGVVILLMLSGGQLLELYAMARARRELTALLSRAPETAHIKEGDMLRDVPIQEVLVGALVLVKPGEIVPVDGLVLEGRSSVDEATLSGESLPVEKLPGSLLFAGTENKEGALVVRVEKAASETRFEHIVALVRQAEEAKAPMVRLADRYSVYFTAVTALFAAAAWFLFGDVTRVLAVLVVATPCPLILATPIALMSGMSRAAKRGVIVKGGGALEALARVRTFVFDKTGTVTLGVPQVAEVRVFGAPTADVLQVAASLDQLSAHVLARALTTHAQRQKLALSYPTQFSEVFGDGVSGQVDGIPYVFGKLSFVQARTKTVPPEALETHEAAALAGTIPVYLASEEAILGVVLFADEVRPDARALFAHLRALGAQKLVLLTGDKAPRAKAVAQALTVTEYKSDCLPEDKLAYIQSLPQTLRPVAMIGDGVNDAPALANADVGIALGAHGKTASSDVADIVVLSSSVSRVGEVVALAQRAIRIAKEGIWFGMSASVLLMIAALFGYVAPVHGALLQELIDVLVIVNALRVARAVAPVQ